VVLLLTIEPDIQPVIEITIIWHSFIMLL